MKVWSCKIGTRGDVHLPEGADGPMRESVEKAYQGLTGQESEALFSGWGDSFTEGEVAVIENREPRYELTERLEAELAEARRGGNDVMIVSKWREDVLKAWMIYSASHAAQSDAQGDAFAAGYWAAEDAVRPILRELAVTLEHARVFIESRQRMHSDGLALYDDALKRARACLARLEEGK
jgi:hypothetical protein